MTRIPRIQMMTTITMNTLKNSYIKKPISIHHPFCKLHITAMSVPSKYFLQSGLIQCFTEDAIDLNIAQFIHGKMNISTILAEVIFH
jgi:hypothetical protein